MQRVDKSPALSPLENAVLELVQQLPEMASYKAASDSEACKYRLHEPINLDLEVVVERFPPMSTRGEVKPKAVFAIQFMRTALDLDPYPRNLATFLPVVTAGASYQMPWVMPQRPGGREYALRITERLNMGAEVAKALILCATNPPANFASLTHENIHQMHEFVKQHGVMGAIKMMGGQSDCWQHSLPVEAPQAEAPRG